MSLDGTRRVGVLIRHNTLLRLRDPGQMIAYLIMPMVIMLVFKPLYVRALDGSTVQVVTGPLVMFSVFALAIVGNSIFLERDWRTWDRLRASSASATELLLGKTVPVFVILLVQQSVLLVYGSLVIGLPIPRSVGYLALAVLVWGFALLAIGAALATIVRSFGELSLVTDLGAITLSAIGGALVPVSLMPGWIQVLAHGSPGYWALEMMQAAVRGDAMGTLRPAGVLLAVGLLAGVFAARRLAHGWDRSNLI